MDIFQCPNVTFRWPKSLILAAFIPNHTLKHPKRNFFCDQNDCWFEMIEGETRFENWRCGHIVPCGKFHRIGGAPLETFPNVKYDAPEEVGGNGKCFDSPIRKIGLIQILYVNRSRALTLCSLTVFCCR